MISETVLNIDRILPYVYQIGYIILAGIGLFLLYNAFGLRLFVKKDEKIAEKFLDKFPLVHPDFYKKPSPEQMAENNQEIHELRKDVEYLKDENRQLKDYIKSQLENIAREIEKRG